VRKFPEPIQNLVASLSRLPGVGPKTALRYVFFLLKQPKSDLDMMARTLVSLGERVKVCDRCFTYTEANTCRICLDPKRDTSLLCVVEEARDISTIESTNTYQGFYHVLGGCLNPLDGITPDVLRMRQLTDRLKANENVTEVILALPPNVQGETTMMYISKQLEPLKRRITRLARGLPIGASIEFADEITLGDAMKGRKETK